MARVCGKIEQQNGKIALNLLGKYGEFVECAKITYYVDGTSLFDKSGKVMVNRRDNFPKIQILSPDTGDYTDTFQENSCIFTDLGNLDLISVETSYTPYKIGKSVNIKVIIKF